MDSHIRETLQENLLEAMCVHVHVFSQHTQCFHNCIITAVSLVQTFPDLEH